MTTKKKTQSKEEKMNDIYSAYAKVTSKLIKKFDPQDVASVMTVQAICLYKTILPTEAFDTLMKELYDSKDAFKEYPHPVERVIFYAISFGGESNKIASMAGAIAGAFFSSQDLPRYLLEMCESYKDTQMYAQRLFEISIQKTDFDEIEKNEFNSKENQSDSELLHQNI